LIRIIEKVTVTGKEAEKPENTAFVFIVKWI